MSFKLHQEPQVESDAQAQLLLKIEHARKTMKSPHELVEHVIKLYGAEFVKCNARIADLTQKNKELFDLNTRAFETNKSLGKSLEASGQLLAEQKAANNELFKLKQKVVIVNRELLHRNNELATENSNLRIRIEQIAQLLQGVEFDFSKHQALRTLTDVEAHKIKAEDTPA